MCLTAIQDLEPTFHTASANENKKIRPLSFASSRWTGGFHSTRCSSDEPPFPATTTAPALWTIDKMTALAVIDLCSYLLMVSVAFGKHGHIPSTQSVAFVLLRTQISTWFSSLPLQRWQSSGLTLLCRFWHPNHDRDSLGSNSTIVC